VVLDDFYHRRIMAAGAVLHVGCGSGALLHHARDAGHHGTLAGVDPDPAQLERARRREDIEWVLGTAAALPFEQEFDLAVLTGDAFPAGQPATEIRAVIAGVRAALREGGRFVFDTRHPDPDVLNRLLREAGFRVEEQHGGPLTPIVTVARRH
jgi:SAM-dependent methyltransferase